PAGFPAGWVRWAVLAVFAALVVAGLLSMRPNPPTAVIAAVVALGAGVLLIQQRRPLLVYAAVATARISAPGHDSSTNITWFAVCLIVIWCALVGQRRDVALYWTGAVLFFTAEWLWILDDRGWAAWMGGVTLCVLLGLLIRQQIDLVAQLQEAQ